ncbi:MAG: ATP-binding protein [Coprococcus sp.]
MRGKKMKHKIYMQFCMIAALAIIATSVIVTGLFYRRFKAQVFNDVRTYAYVLTSVDAYNEAKLIDEIHELDNLRVTIISPEGKVLLDTNADIGGMDNHGTREEVKEAFEKGEGQAVRQSRTVAKATYYFAVLMEDGNVLRVATETGSIFSIVRGIVPMVMMMALLLFIICTVLGRLLTDSLLRPIEQMAKNMDYVSEISVYEEMEPFIDTIRRQHEDILKNASMRQDFTANVSHELKTPLAAISGYSELIENGMVSEKDVARFGAEIHKSADRLLTLINDTIRLSELDATTADKAMETIDLYKVADACMDTLQISARKHDVTLKLEGTHCRIRAEKGMADEVIFNLCDNAIRYNNKGGSVTVTVLPSDNQVILAVRDTGIGISKEHQDRIFERFYRVDKSRSKSTGGTGLGLAIVKHIVARNGARMELTSEVGKGTEIRIYFDKAA